jgi:hypothetical protein
MRESAGCAPARSTIIGEPEATPIPFRRVEKMTGDHPRNTDPVLSSLRCGAKTRSGKPFGSPAVIALADSRDRVTILEAFPA